MTYILKNGIVYEQTLSEVEIDLATEEYKLQAWKDALVSDARERAEMEAKLAEIDKLTLDKDSKERIKSQFVHSHSGITKKMVDEQQAKLDEIYSIKKK